MYEPVGADVEIRPRNVRGSDVQIKEPHVVFRSLDNLSLDTKDPQVKKPPTMCEKSCASAHVRWLV